MRKSLHRLLPVAFFAALLDPSYAASAAVEINAPLPEIRRERIAAMLRIVRPKDAAAALDATRILGSTWPDGGPLIMRVETDCRDGLCMTVIARVTEDAVLPDLILNAGKVFSGSDSGAELWGSDRPIWWLTFEGRDGARLLAAERGGRWIVEAGGPFDPNRRVVPELRTPLPPVPFLATRAVRGVPEGNRQCPVGLVAAHLPMVVVEWSLSPSTGAVYCAMVATKPEFPHTPSS